MSETTAASHAIDDLVRTINPATFSASAHGAGHHVVLARNQAGPHRKSLFGRWLSGEDEKHYFVKKWTVPKEVKGWRFRWSEGTTAISLDFDASFVIQANEDTQAYRLVEALCAPPGPGDALYGLIDSALHEELDRLLARSTQAAASLLDAFRDSSIAAGESAALNASVSDRVRAALGGATFRIGFRLLDAPPMQVEVHRVGSLADPFTLRDSRRQHVVETKALLRLENYQAFRRSGLRTEDDVRAAVGAAITQAVKSLLFGCRYYDVVQTFWQGPDPIAGKMHRHVEKEARAIGYAVQMFHALPDLAALEVLQPMRIDIDAKDEKYELRNSVGYVQVGVALVTQAGDDVSKLHLLVEPDATDVVTPIAARVRRICRDTIQRFDHLAFNLEFDEKVVPALTTAICDGLGSFGLSTTIVNIRQELTEEGERFKAIRGRTIDFEALIPPQANQGRAFAVPVTGTIGVVSMTPDGWEAFESKDFGYRSDSPVTEHRMRLLAEQRGVAVPADTWSQAERRNVAIDLELAEMGHRVRSILEGRMAMGPDLAQHWSTARNDAQISAWAEKLAIDAIAAEFGLAIRFRAFRRLDTAGEAKAQADTMYELGQQDREREAFDTQHLKLIESLGHRDNDALLDPGDPDGEAAAARVREGFEQRARQRRLASDQTTAVQPHGTVPDNAKELPWQPPAREAPDAPSDGT